MAHPGSELDIGSRAILSGEGASAELITRAITRGGTVISRGHIVGEVGGSSGSPVSQESIIAYATGAVAPTTPVAQIN